MAQRDSSTGADRTVLDSLVWLSEPAFDGDPAHSLTANLRSLADPDWTAAPPGDAELDRERLANWGERLPTRTLIRILIAHDYYHAGEINHLRALLHHSDRWEYDQDAVG